MANSANSDTLILAQRWLEEGRRVALATVVETWSSAPVPTGSQMIVDADSAAYGSLAGGCVENDVIAAATATLTSGQPGLQEFIVGDDAARLAGLPCGGRIKIYIERLN